VEVTSTIFSDKLLQQARAVRIGKGNKAVHLVDSFSSSFCRKLAPSAPIPRNLRFSKAAGTGATAGRKRRPGRPPS
jgi:hypothetical protein